jgi:hypothetical protein
MKVLRPRLAAALAPITLGVAAAITVGTLAGGASPAAAQTRLDAAVKPASSVPVMVTCTGKHVVRPVSYVQACGDGNSWLGHMKWQSWQSATAHGSGIQAVNDCVPDCAQGTFYYFPVQVKLWRPEALSGQTGGQYFSRMTETFPGRHCMPGYDGTRYCIPSPDTTHLLGAY